MLASWHAQVTVNWQRHSWLLGMTSMVLLRRASYVLSVCCARALDATCPATGTIADVPLCACAQSAQGGGITQTANNDVANSVGLGIATPSPIAVPTLVPAIGRRRRRKH